MNTTVLILEGALATLRRDGWCQGTPYTIHGRRCLEFALAAQCRSRHRLLAVIQFAERVAGTERLAEWNDAPERAFADIEALLTATIAIAQDQPKDAVTV